MGTFSQPNIGSLRHRLAIEAITSQSADIYNEQTPTYGTVGNRWAKIDNQSSVAISVNQASTRANLDTIQITMRYFEGLGINHRLRYGVYGFLDMTAQQLAALTAAEYAALTIGSDEPPQYYRIIGVNDPEQRRRWMVVQAVRGTG